MSRTTHRSGVDTPKPAWHAFGVLTPKREGMVEQDAPRETAHVTEFQRHRSSRGPAAGGPGPHVIVSGRDKARGAHRIRATGARTDVLVNNAGLLHPFAPTTQRQPAALTSRPQP